MNEVRSLNWKAEMEIRLNVGDKETKELVTTLGKERVLPLLLLSRGTDALFVLLLEEELEIGRGMHV